MMMDTATVLDSINETTVFIPYKGSERNEESPKTHSLTVPTPPDLVAIDIPEGPQIRLEVFHDAWEKCLTRMRDILQDLNERVVDNVASAVRDAYLIPELQLLPRVELPTIVIQGTDRSATVSFFDDLRRELSTEWEDESTENDAKGHDTPSNRSSSSRTAYVTSLSAVDSPNLTSAMKALITGFVNISPDEAEEQPQRKPSTSLASYDINLLEAWYDVVRKVSDVNKVDLPRLVVLLHDFEQFDASVVQDIFYICSLHIPRLPLVFVLAVSSPSQPSFLHATYPRNILSLLQIQKHTLKGGIQALESILLKTFFDLEFEPDVMLGPSTLQFVVEQLQRYDSSIDSAISLLQLIHLRHFVHPLTVLVNDEHLGTKSASVAAKALRNPSHSIFLRTLLLRLDRPHTADDDDAQNAEPQRWNITDVGSLLEAVSSARALSRTRVRKRRVGFTVFRLVRRFLSKQGYRSVDSGTGNSSTVFDLMIGSLRGTLSDKEGKYLVMMVKKLTADKLVLLLKELQTFFQNQPARVQNEEEAMRSKIVDFTSKLARSDDVIKISNEVGESLTHYFRECMTNYRDTALWDVWYTGQASILAELVNPSPHSTTVTGLVHPERYLSYGASLNGSNKDVPKPVTIPDTSILFQRYLESGRMINVYDWFDSFSLALDSQKKECSLTPEGLGKGKGKAFDTTLADDQDDEDHEEADQDRRRREVQARFIRSIHELDFLGFIKHTGRKADHVMKTVYDLPD